MRFGGRAMRRTGMAWQTRSYLGRTWAENEPSAMLLAECPAGQGSAIGRNVGAVPHAAASRRLPASGRAQSKSPAPCTLPASLASCVVTTAEPARNRFSAFGQSRMKTTRWSGLILASEPLLMMNNQSSRNGNSFRRKWMTTPFRARRPASPHWPCGTARLDETIFSRCFTSPPAAGQACRSAQPKASISSTSPGRRGGNERQAQLQVGT